MQTIVLDKVLPEIFQEKGILNKSQIWTERVEIQRGNAYLVEAASGTGKSTLLSYLLGYRDDYSGEVTFDSVSTKSFTKGDWANIRQREISALYQDLKLFLELTAWENVQIKNKLTKYTSAKKIKEQFEQLGIADKLNVKAAKLSFGQQQRVALIRALSQPFDFILLDEPISHLDDDNAKVMANMIMQRLKECGAGAIVTSIGQTLPIDYDTILKL